MIKQLNNRESRTFDAFTQVFSKLQEEKHQARFTFDGVDEALVMWQDEQNKKFIWTELSREQFFRIQQQLVEKLSGVWDKAVSVSRELDKQIESGVQGLLSYEIKVYINPHMDSNDDWDKHYLTEIKTKRYLSESIRHSQRNNDDKISPNLLESLYHAHLHDPYRLWLKENEVITLMMHRIIKLGWAYEDILSINSVTSDIEVSYKICSDNEPLKIG